MRPKAKIKLLNLLAQVNPPGEWTHTPYKAIFGNTTSTTFACVVLHDWWLQNNFKVVISHYQSYSVMQAGVMMESCVPNIIGNPQSRILPRKMKEDAEDSKVLFLLIWLIVTNWDVHSRHDPQTRHGIRGLGQPLFDTIITMTRFANTKIKQDKYILDQRNSLKT